MSFEEFKERYLAKIRGINWYGEQMEVTDLELMKLFASIVVISEFHKEEAKKEKGRK
ncbi:hypothetical protein [Sporosarcina sp. FSL K6-5500]|uniref:hypothetical protein n=1 Tax=Sporosarcina sp. FSL K6-5500 TaxID=2921558 RepID=UPI0030F58AC8